MAVEVNFNLPDGCDPAEICAMEEALRLHRPLDVWNGKFEEAQIFVSLAGRESDKPVGKKVRFRHQPDGPDRVISAVNLDGMVSIHGFSGWFAPDLFVEVEDLR